MTTLTPERVTHEPRGVSTPTGPTAHQRRRRACAGFLAPLTLLLVALTLGPFLSNLYLSLTDATPSEPLGGFVGLDNYRQLLQSGLFWSSVRVTLLFTLGAVSIQLVLGVGVAVTLAGVGRGRRALQTLFLLPMAATPVAVLFGWRTLLNATFGPLNYALGLLGLPQPDWLGSAGTALAAMILIDVWQWTPFVLIITLGALSTLPHDQIEAADVDGANAWQRFVHVVLPHLRPYILVAALFRVIDCLKEFDKFQVLTGGGPGDATTTLNMLAYRVSLRFLDFGSGAAVATLLLVLSILVSQVLLRWAGPKDPS